MTTRIYINLEDKIEKGENNLVNLTLKTGETFENLEPRRLFPIRYRDKYITLLSYEGEVAVIKELSDLDESSRKVIINSLDDYYLVPKITKIISTSDKYGTLRWTVETDRGIHSFDIRNRNYDIRVYKSGEVRVRDADDNRYVIEDYKALDAASRARLLVHT